jgi:predicted transcriptional regulator
MGAKPNITRAEMDVLRYVLDHQPVTLRQIADAMAEKKQLAKTTTQTLLERLRKKGAVLRDAVDGLNQYRSTLAREEVYQNVVDDFVSGTLGGSLSPIVAYLTDRADLTESEVADLQQLLDKLEGDGK